MEKGFHSLNLIAVDIDNKCITNVRQSKNLGICGRIEDLIAVWPADWPIDAIVGDFTCGLDNKTMKIFQASLFVSRALQFGKTVIAVNMQRGRDPDSNPVRDTLSQVKEIEDKLGWLGTNEYQRIVDIMTDNLHRGKQLITVFLCHCLKSVETRGKLMDYPDRFMKGVNPLFTSYRQNDRMPYMDSAVFTMPYGDRGDYDDMLQIYMEMAGRDPRELKPKIAALRAVRTMKWRDK